MILALRFLLEHHVLPLRNRFAHAVDRGERIGNRDINSFGILYRYGMRNLALPDQLLAVVLKRRSLILDAYRRRQGILTNQFSGDGHRVVGDDNWQDIRLAVCYRGKQKNRRRKRAKEALCGGEEVVPNAAHNVYGSNRTTARLTCR